MMQGQGKKNNARVAMPGQLVNEDPDYPFDNPNETPIGPNDAQKAAKKLKQNNFFQAEKTPNAHEAINELE